MIVTDPTHLLFIEPTAAPSLTPIIDDITRKMTAAWRQRVSRGAYYGVHDCTGRGCRASSDNRDHTVAGDVRELSLTGGGRQTNSLCVHYVAYHRDQIPAHHLDVIASFPLEGVDPTPEELGQR